MSFPQYRKYPNNKSYFKITSDNHFEEIAVIGSKYSVNEFSAKIFPDFTFIKDMLDNRDNRWVVISSAEYDSVLKICLAEKTLLS
jgi:hypothetical protein